MKGRWAEAPCVIARFEISSAGSPAEDWSRKRPRHRIELGWMRLYQGIRRQVAARATTHTVESFYNGAGRAGGGRTVRRVPGASLSKHHRRTALIIDFNAVDLCVRAGSNRRLCCSCHGSPRPEAGACSCSVECAAGCPGSLAAEAVTGGVTRRQGGGVEMRERGIRQFEARASRPSGAGRVSVTVSPCVATTMLPRTMTSAAQVVEVQGRDVGPAYDGDERRRG